jgi:hypothetical protein
MPTNLIPSVCTSVILVFPVIIFELFMKCWRTLFHRYIRR